MFAPLWSQSSLPSTSPLFPSISLALSHLSSASSGTLARSSWDFWHFSSPLTQSFGTPEGPKWAWGDSRRTQWLSHSKPAQKAASSQKSSESENKCSFKQWFPHQSALAWGSVALSRCWGPPRTPTVDPWSWGSGRWWAFWFWQTCRHPSWSSRCASSGRQSRWWLNETRLPGSGSEGPYLLDVLPLQREPWKGGWGRFNPYRVKISHLFFWYQLCKKIETVPTNKPPLVMPFCFLHRHWPHWMNQ